MSSTTTALAVVAAAWDHTSRRARVSACHKPATVAGSSWKNVRYSVESDGTSPNSAGWARSFSISLHASPPPAIINIPVHHHLAPVVNREALGHDRDTCRQQISQTQTVGETAKSVQTDMGHHPLPAGLHPQSGRAGSVHLRDALLVGSCTPSTSAVSLARRALSRTLPSQLTRSGE
jgi:hypothetical protein